jgi:hypothetical protein
MIGKVEMTPNRGVQLLGVDCGTVTIEPFLESVFGFTNILNLTDFARDKIYHIGSGAGDGANGLVSAPRFTDTRAILPDVIIAYNTLPLALESALCSRGGGRVMNGWDFSPD